MKKVTSKTSIFKTVHPIIVELEQRVFKIATIAFAIIFIATAILNLQQYDAFFAGVFIGGAIVIAPTIVFFGGLLSMFCGVLFTIFISLIAKLIIRNDSDF